MNSYVTLAADALRFRLATDAEGSEMRFPCPGSSSTPDVMHEILQPGEGPPLHKHPWASWDLVIRGRVRVLLGEETFELGPGDLVYTAPDEPHTFMGIGDEEIEMVGFGFPGGFHELYASFEDAVDADGAPDFGKMAAAAAAHGATLLGPPLSVLEAAEAAS